MIDECSLNPYITQQTRVIFLAQLRPKLVWMILLFLQPPTLKNKHILQSNGSHIYSKHFKTYQSHSNTTFKLKPNTTNKNTYTCNSHLTQHLKPGVFPIQYLRCLRHTLNGDKHDNAWGSTWNDTSLCSWRWIPRHVAAKVYIMIAMITDWTSDKANHKFLDIALPLQQHVQSHESVTVYHSTELQ